MRLIWGVAVASSLGILGCGTAEPVGATDAGTDPGHDAAVTIDGAIQPVDVGVSLDDSGTGPGTDASTVAVDAASEPCTVAGTIEHLPCGMCGTLDRFCAASLTWSYGTCTGEHGVCAPGTTQPAGSCGRCGTQAQFCDLSCTWLPMGACTGETGTCLPGSTTRVATGCPTGQTRVETCSDTCVATDGACEAAECTPGLFGMTSCGMCGTAQQMCDPSGHWILTTACAGEGECVAGATSSLTCAVCGTQAAMCDATCHWQTTGACVGGVTCGPPPTPTCRDAMTLRTYAGAAMCSSGSCTYSPIDVPCTGACSAGACTGGTTVLHGLGGPADFGQYPVAIGDDPSSAAIMLTAAWGTGLHYYAGTYASFYVNNNGNVSFGSPQMAYTPVFPGAMAPMIAAFWADVDTNGRTVPTNDIVTGYADDTRVIVTWYRVGYFTGHHDKENTFQLILTRRTDVAPGDFDVELRYEQCQWTTGDASGGLMGLGGMAASAGFDAGDRVRSLALPGSGTAAVLDLCSTSNVGAPGVWRYQVRGGIPM